MPHPTLVPADHGSERRETDRAIGALMALYGLDASRAELLLRLRAAVVSLPVPVFAAELVSRAAGLAAERGSRRHVSEALDQIGA